jgi:hypothetical protein
MRKKPDHHNLWCAFFAFLIAGLAAFAVGGGMEHVCPGGKTPESRVSK